MDGDAVQPATAQAVEGPAEGVSAFARRLGGLVPGAFAAAVVSVVGVSHGGYYATAWGPMTLVFLAVAAIALVVRPRPALGWRELAVPALLAGIAVWALLSSTWGVPTEAVPEAQRALAYTAGALAFALVLRRERVAGFLVGVWLGICIVCIDALAGRLFPERFGEYDPIGIYRLSEPVGYWNALGVLAAFGVLLALHLVGRVDNLAVRLAAAASTVPLALTLYFTFSRGAWLSLAAGLLLVPMLDPRRLQLAATVLVVGPWPALAVVLAASSGPLTETGHTLASASADGHQLAAVGVGLALGAAGAAAFVTAVGPRVRVSSSIARAANLGVVVALVAVVLVVVVFLGGPSQMWSSFSAQPRDTDGQLNERLFDLSGNGRVEAWRAALDQADEHRVAGAGGGSYQRYWLETRPYALNLRDAHSLYLESLAEYGPLGLALVVAMLAIPLAVGVRRRHVPLVPAAVGVLVLYGVHAAVDWDWEFPVLTLVALAGAAAVMASGEPRAVATTFERRRIVLLALVLALVPVAALGALGARAEAASADAVAEKDFDRAASEARRAEQLEPWSVEPLLLLGRAQALAGDREVAQSTFRRALRREPGNWRLWYELAAVSTGAERRAALREARALNPLEDLLRSLGQGP
jgi:tetratricopeptide (TPR) repeat protein